MSDREKVIKGIQECDLNGGLIGNCPYKGILLLLKEQEKENSRIAKEYLNLVKVASKQPKIVLCKDCAKYDRKTGICSSGINHGYSETWFCADSEPKNKQLDYEDKDTAYYADTPVIMPAT